MTKSQVDNFEKQFRLYLDKMLKVVATQKGDWVVKGFIDIAKNIYTISVDTKVISKILELLLFPVILEFAKKFNYKVILCEAQNFYPDITLISSNGTKIALDLKSTYRINDSQVNGFTLGAYTGYFRDRKSKKNIAFPYCEYAKHYVLGIIYSRRENKIDERKVYSLDQLTKIVSVVKDFEFILQEKYKIASDHTGSGNTKNIGSAKDLKKLRKGEGVFSKLGIEIFDKYWTNYMTLDMARSADFKKPPYNNLTSFFKYFKIK
jgi:hypothetical protein